MLKVAKLPALVVAILLAIVVAASVLWLGGGGGGASTPARELAADDRVFDDDDPVARGCALDQEILRRIQRGFDPDHSEDVTTVPLWPNYSGAFSVTSHSGPWDYLQRVPLVFYGPDYIKPLGSIEREASITDVYPTVGRLLNARLEPRDGTSRDLMLESGLRPPKLIVTIMWDGVGRNVLERWPDDWPNLARLQREGTSFANATVGSSPSITPATHSSLGTGAWPRHHGVTAIEYRTDEGTVRSSFADRNPSDLDITTWADQIDQAYGNQSIVGMLAWRSWHLGMMGHGTGTPGGDADQLGIIGFDERITGNSSFYSTPSYLKGFSGLDERVDQLDREDGKVDGEWMGHSIAEQHDNPAWVRYQTDVLLGMLKREGYGTDEIPDLFFTNYKMTDIVGHQYSMDSDEMPAVLRAQDEALGEIVDYLDANVEDYVLVLSADHGHTPSPERSGAWPILQGRLRDDLDEHFGITDGRLVEVSTAVGPFLDREVARSNDVTEEEVAEFLNGYTIRDNWADEQLPEGYEERGDENVFEAAFPSAQLGTVMECAFETRASG